MKKFISLVIVALCFCACDDDEVKEYQTQCDSKESCEKECDEGNGAACHSLAALRYELSVEQEITYAQKSCDLHYAKGCSWLAHSYGREYGEDFAKKHYQKAFKMLQKSCEQNHNGSGCGSLGYLYYEGKGVTKDFEKALSYYEKGCDQNDSYSCRLLGNLYYEGEGATKDFDKALSYHKKACELGAYYCGWFGYLYLKDKKYNEAKYFYEKGCDKGDGDDCRSLSDLYYKGEGVTQDFEKAFSYDKKALEKDCDKGDGDDCRSLGHLYYEGKDVTQDFNKALSYYEKGCDKNDSYSCRLLGNLYYEGEGATKDFDKALSYHKKACELNTYECPSVGPLYLKDKKYNEAKYFYEKGCDQNDGYSCELLGNLYYEGEGATKDFDKALSYHKRACELGW